ncbi:nucleotidyltransferase family protein [Daejeonella sp.]|uniref:nucleotidyltransferase family protein n=1 Tax=Daejeonella sp. TaxID=2805397 RepID=UPI0027309055|nr:nucleotidyltransferase domain-containing protein [Daejeonella sp.]MDP2412286.1 nucleotidyltransferase domain-containing protein [Daejeonella sp.]
MNILSIYLNDVKQLCDSYKVRSLFAFGSVTTERFNANSDIDFIVDIADDDPLSYSDKYFDLKSRLEELFKRKIDLLEHKTIINPYLKARIDQTKVLVYGN